MERFFNSKIGNYILAGILITINVLMIKDFESIVISSLIIILGELFHLNTPNYKLKWWNNLNENDKIILKNKYFSFQNIYSLTDREIISIYDREHK